MADFAYIGEGAGTDGEPDDVFILNLDHVVLVRTRGKGLLTVNTADDRTLELDKDRSRRLLWALTNPPGTPDADGPDTDVHNVSWIGGSE